MQHRSPEALRNYTLTCEVDLPPTLILEIPTYQWLKNGVIVAYTIFPELDLSPLNLSETNTSYICQCNASSEYLSRILVLTSPPHRLLITSMQVVIEINLLK